MQCSVGASRALGTLLGESAVCSAMVVSFVSGPLQAHLREAADERREKKTRVVRLIGAAGYRKIHQALPPKRVSSLKIEGWQCNISKVTSGGRTASFTTSELESKAIP